MKNELFNFGDFFISKVVISLIFLMSIGLLGNQWLDLNIQIVVGLNYMEIIWGWGHPLYIVPPYGIMHYMIVFLISFLS